MSGHAGGLLRAPSPYNGDMALHIVKLCVGVDSAEDLAAWIDFRAAEQREQGLEPEQIHTTRMAPARRDEVLDGGSLYWVIKGAIQVRQRIVDLRSITDASGVKRCQIVLEPVLHHTRAQPRRPFQGWRYLKAEDAPADLTRSDAGADIPEAMRRELVELCLI